MFCKNCGAPITKNYPNKEVLSTIQYLLMFMVFSIPLAGIILLPIWSFKPGVNINKRNISRAFLVLYGVGVIIYVLAFIYMTGISGY